MQISSNYATFASAAWPRTTDSKSGRAAEFAGQDVPTSGQPSRAAATASHRQAVNALVSILDMAAPKNSPGTLGSPFMALSLTAPPAGQQDTQGTWIAPDADLVMDPTPATMAAQIVKQLGSDGVLTLQDAEQALAVPNPGKLSNTAQTVDGLFKQVDANHDGQLSQAELQNLMSYYMDNVTATQSPKLPGITA